MGVNVKDGVEVVKIEELRDEVGYEKVRGI